MKVQRQTALTLLILAAGLVLAASAWADACLECHKAPEFRVQQPKLYSYFQEFDASVHGVAGLGCADCHGGDPTTDDMEKAHENVLIAVRYDNIPKTCGGCHEAQRDEYLSSGHYDILAGDGTAPNCATCHGAMEMDFIFVTRVKSTCLFCHNQESDLFPEVPAQADYVLNKINIIKGYRSYVNAYAKDREMVQELEVAYQDLTAKWHRFDLEDIEDDTGELLGNYRKAKAQAMKDRKN